MEGFTHAEATATDGFHAPLRSAIALALFGAVIVAWPSAGGVFMTVLQITFLYFKTGARG